MGLDLDERIFRELKGQFIAFLDFRVVSSLDGEAWFCRKTSLKVEMVADKAGA